MVKHEKDLRPAERLPSLPFVEAGSHQGQVDLLTRQIEEIESVRIAFRILKDQVGPSARRR